MNQYDTSSLKTYAEAELIADQIFAAVQTLPLEIQKFVFDEVRFIGSSNDSQIAYIARHSPPTEEAISVTEKWIILGPAVFNLIKDDMIPEFQEKIATSIAHLHLEHKAICPSLEQYEQQDEEALEQVRKWLFETPAS